jgi:hypothetical chaperone protein
MRQAGLSASRIDALFLTGGSTQIPHVRAAVMAAVPDAKVVEGDTFGSVGKGLTLEAGRRYGGLPETPLARLEGKGRSDKHAP